MRSRTVVIVSAAVAVAVALFGTVAFGIYTGITDGQHKAAVKQDAIVTGTAPRASARQDSASTAAAPSLGIAQPAGGTFTPGSPPFGGTGGVSADGLTAWGVAYRSVSDANAQADAALVKAAYQDAEKKATDLANATGNKLGKLLALADYSSAEPYFKPCVQTGVPAPGKPVPDASGATGSGTANPGSVTSSGPAIEIAPAPCQATGNNNYLVVWVYVRHAL